MIGPNRLQDLYLDENVVDPELTCRATAVPYSNNFLPCYIERIFHESRDKKFATLKDMLDRRCLVYAGKRASFDYRYVGQRPSEGYRLFIILFVCSLKRCLRQGHCQDARSEGILAQGRFPEGSLIATVSVEPDYRRDTPTRDVAGLVGTLITLFIAKGEISPNHVYLVTAGPDADVLFTLIPWLQPRLAGAAYIPPDFPSRSPHRCPYIDLSLGSLYAGSEFIWDYSYLNWTQVSALHRHCSRHAKSPDSFVAEAADEADVVLSFEWLSQKIRNPYKLPLDIEIKTNEMNHNWYWVTLLPEDITAGNSLRITKSGDCSFYITSENITCIYVKLNDALFLFRKKIEIYFNGKLCVKRKLARDLNTVRSTLEMEFDPFLSFANIIFVDANVQHQSTFAKIKDSLKKFFRKIFRMPN